MHRWKRQNQNMICNDGARPEEIKGAEGLFIMPRKMLITKAMAYYSELKIKVTVDGEVTQLLPT
jgi:hypothetical protein